MTRSDFITHARGKPYVHLTFTTEGKRRAVWALQLSDHTFREVRRDGGRVFDARSAKGQAVTQTRLIVTGPSDVIEVRSAGLSRTYGEL